MIDEAMHWDHLKFDDVKDHESLLSTQQHHRIRCAEPLQSVYGISVVLL